MIDVSDDKTRLDLDQVHALLKRTHWAKDRTRETIEKSIRNSLCFGAYEGETLLGFARVVTDGCTFAYLCDVIVEEAHRGRGISRKLMEKIMAHAELQSYRKFLLATRSAHGLYAKFGFHDAPEGRFMEIHHEGI